MRGGGGARFSLKTNSGLVVEMHYNKGGAELMRAGKKLDRVDGMARLVTDLHGTAVEVIGIADGEQTVELTRPGSGARTITLTGNERVAIRR